MFDRPMLRYYALAAALVVIGGALLVAHRLAVRDFDVRSTVAVTPHAADAASGEPRPGATFSSDAPWALSALPGCFDQLERTVGPGVQVPPPAAALRVAPGTALRAGACRIEVRSDELWIERGSDRLRVPPHAALYREPDGSLVTEYRHGTQRELRRYRVR